MNPATCEVCSISLPSSLVFKMEFRGAIRRICPRCVLVNHPSDYCPHCFELHTQPLHPPSRTICTTCPSIAHASCAAPAPAANSPVPTIPYRCPSCTNSNFTFFDIQKNNMVLDRYLSKQLLAAAKISVQKARHMAESSRLRAEAAAEKAVKARREAKEAVERVLHHEATI